MQNFLDLKVKSVSTGLLLLFFGLLLLFHTLGLVSIVTTIIMVTVSCGLIFIGLIKSGLYETIRDAVSKKK